MHPDMEKLLNEILQAHGGLSNWERLDSIRMRARIGGSLWKWKGQEGLLSDTHITIDTKTPFVSYEPKGVDWHSSFQPNRVAVHQEEATLEELREPRASFAGHRREMQWSRLQTLYFASYAMWQYANTPFLFARPGFALTEEGVWREDGEEWRRLTVTLPADIPTHCALQTFYVDKNGLIRRHDYQAEVAGGSTVAHYLDDYVDIGGFRFPTRREVFPRAEDNTAQVIDPPLVSIALSNIVLNR